MSEQDRSIILRLEAENARLKAEVERLRKAGERLANIAHTEGYGDALGEWEAAKEVQP